MAHSRKNGGPSRGAAAGAAALCVALLAAVAAAQGDGDGASPQDAAVKVVSDSCDAKSSVSLGCDGGVKWQVSSQMVGGRSTLTIANADGPVVRVTDSGLDVVGERSISVNGMSISDRLAVSDGEQELLRQRIEELEKKVSNVSTSLTCRGIKERNAFATSGMYEVEVIPGQAKQQVYCDMLADGGGWMLAVAGNGRESIEALTGTPTLSSTGRLKVSSASEFTHIRFQFGYASTGSKVNFMNADSEPGRAFVGQALVGFSDDREAAGLSSFGVNTISWVAAEGNTCTSGVVESDKMSRIYWPTHAHTWLFHHTGGTPSGTMFGSSYNRICDVNQGVVGYPSQYVRVWFR